MKRLFKSQIFAQEGMKISPVNGSMMLGSSIRLLNKTKYLRMKRLKYRIILCALFASCHNQDVTYPDYKYYGPLPYNELVINKKLVQNEGWDHP